jgi:hypothetical protein
MTEEEIFMILTVIWNAEVSPQHPKDCLFVIAGDDTRQRTEDDEDEERTTKGTKLAVHCGILTFDLLIAAILDLV